MTLEDLLSHPYDKKVIPALEVNDLLGRLKKANGKIHPLASDIIEMRFGLKEGQQPHTLAEISKKLGISRERVRQIEEQTMVKMKGILNERD